MSLSGETTPPASVSFAGVVPMFDEAAGAARCIEAIENTLKTFGDSAALIVVDDGSSDGTQDILKVAAPRYPRLVFHERNQGYGAALATGTKIASQRGFDYVLFMDSDLTT